MVGEIFSIIKKRNEKLVFILNIDSIKDIEISNHRKFEEIFHKLSSYITNSYKKDNINKIVLITSKLKENQKKFLINLTFANTNRTKNNKQFLLRESKPNNKISSANSFIKKYFNGKIKIIFYKNRGRVIECYFNLK